MNKRNRGLLIFTICISAIFLLCNLYGIIGLTAAHIISTNMNLFLYSILFTLVLCECIWVLATVLRSGTVHLKTLFLQVSVISLTVILASVIFPRIQGYRVLFELLAWGGFTLLDGQMFIVGILLLSLGCILRMGIESSAAHSGTLSSPSEYSKRKK